MKKQEVKKGRGRPPIYQTEEEKKEAIKESKTRYMLNKEWYCYVCNNNINYSLAGKFCHLKTKKHRDNINRINRDL